MKRSYLDYAMSVIVARALPDARDGLKPVHRRLMYAMRQLRLDPGAGFKKSARVVGDTIGKFHPHGDVAVYDALVRLAQEWNLRHPLIDGQGNFGSIDGDSAAAYRYTEARLTRLAEMMLADIDKETVDFGPNFDDSTTEPLVLSRGNIFCVVNRAGDIAPEGARDLGLFHEDTRHLSRLELTVDGGRATVLSSETDGTFDASRPTSLLWAS